MTRRQNRKALLWAPWRKAYLRSNPAKRKGCLFCRLMRDKKDKKNLVVHRASAFTLILNRFPYNNGHVMIIPKRHIACVSEMDSREKAEFFDVLILAQAALQKALRPHGFNIGMNLSDVAGAGIPGHLHWHIVPRWKGDVNFMPVVANTKVISESLESVYDALQLAIRKGRKGS
ncbi:MAG TPA: HIT domain-containing protein [Candidatus Omnitrophota bacterium]|nr:HIT domain-containing protein [Candidatus Omnitrophota bacterium]